LTGRQLCQSDFMNVLLLQFEQYWESAVTSMPSALAPTGMWLEFFIDTTNKKLADHVCVPLCGNHGDSLLVMIIRCPRLLETLRNFSSCVKNAATVTGIRETWVDVRARCDW
jgi:hypothetical protein